MVSGAWRLTLDVFVFVAEFEIRQPGTEAKLLIKSLKFILMPNRKGQAGATVDNITKDEKLQSVRRHNTNTSVSGCFTQKDVDNFAINFVEWITREDSEFAILYGDADRFCTNKRSYSSEQVLRKFKRSKNSR